MNRVIQGSLLKIAASFLLLQTIIITLSPAVRARSWDVDYRWSQWIALIVWGVFIYMVHKSITRFLPDADPYLFPAAALLSGWGLLTIWRLEPRLGPFQAFWLVGCLVVFLVGLRLPSPLTFLRRYKYILLSSGMALVGLTLLFGTNPIGIGPRLWLGCCGVYFQPSEPLKLLLVAYLAAYLSDRLAIRLHTFSLIYPTLLLSGVTILLLVFQRDLGTASIFITLYTVIIYLATDRRQIVFISILLIATVSLIGYFFIDIIHSRVDSWLNPWVDPKGGSYQIIQSLIAVANGGIEGRGPGLGSPGLVPVVVSDFIFAGIAEETGLTGTLGLIALFGLIVARGLLASLRAPDLFRRLFAAGITCYFGIQALLIIGGNLRLLPLTGVTLPFVSYGGSSLLTSFTALFFLILTSNHLDEEPAPLAKPQRYLAVGAVISLGLFAAALTNGWWAVIRGPDLLTRSDNSRRVIEDRYVLRGDIVDRTNAVITTTQGRVGEFERSYQYPDLAPTVGYDHPVYGQSGLEASLDDYLRGAKGNSGGDIWWNHLLYGMSPKGLDIRLTIDLFLQSRADEMLLGHPGAAVMLNAKTGEILVMASQPTFNANHLDEIGSSLNQDPKHPLINRATQGLYPVGTMPGPFLSAFRLGDHPGQEELQDLYQRIGFKRTPEFQLEVSTPLREPGMNFLHITPLHAALASAALSNHGIVPAPTIASGVNTPTQGWIILPAPGASFEAMPASAADEAAEAFIPDGKNYWVHLGFAQEADTSFTWYIAGTPPNWEAAPIVVIVLLEENNVRLAKRIGDELIVDAMNP